MYCARFAHLATFRLASYWHSASFGPSFHFTNQFNVYEVADAEL